MPPHAIGKDSFEVRAADLDTARRRAGLGVHSGAGWTACSAPLVMLVVDEDGSLRACEYGSKLTPVDEDRSWSDAYGSQPFVGLRENLGHGALPAHCQGCVAYCHEDAHARAPMLREYGDIPAGSSDQPAVLVLRLPGLPKGLAPGVEGQLAKILPRIDTLVLDGVESLTAGAARTALSLVRGSERQPALHLRMRAVGDAEAAAEALRELRVRELELDLGDCPLEELASARRLAAALGAELRARFLFTPGRWFRFEDAAHACAAEPPVPLELRLQARDGSYPLAKVRLEDIALVKTIASSCWSRLSGDGRPASLSPRAMEFLIADLRHLLRQEIGRSQQRGDEGAESSFVMLPPPDHVWCTDPQRQQWWWRHLFGAANQPAVRNWVQLLAEADGVVETLRQQDWLRVLFQRLASDAQEPSVLGALRACYGDAKIRLQLVKSDQAFASVLDLKPFGGPWADRLGLGVPRARKRPFAVGRARKGKGKGKAQGKPEAEAASAPEVTVLIPSFRHGPFIVETIESVLAQDMAGLRVLVVDDLSPDDTVAQASSVRDPRVAVRQNERNLGLGNSVLAALETIDTPFVALLNSDDLFHPARLRRCLEELKAHPQAQLVTTDLSLIDERGGELTPQNASPVLDGRLVFDWVHWYERVHLQEDLSSEQLFAKLLESNFLATSSNLVARTDWLRAQRESLQSLKYCLDWQLFLQAALEGALHHIREPLAAYRLHSSNTVWFREGRRWAYYLEVNRVAATSLSRFAGRVASRDQGSALPVLQALADHLLKNRETDGYALFLNAAVDALRLDEMAQNEQDVQDLVQILNRSAADVRQACDRLAAEQLRGEGKPAAWRRILEDLNAEQARSERDARRWLQSYADSIESRLRDCWEGRNRLEAEKAEQRRRIDELDRRIEGLLEKERVLQEVEAEKVRLSSELADRGRQLQGVRADKAALRSDNEALRKDREALRSEIEAARADAAALRQDLQAARGESEGARQEQQALRQDRDGVRAELAALQAAAAALGEAKQELAAQLQEAQRRLQEAQGRNGTIRQEKDALAQERDRLLAEGEEHKARAELARSEREGLEVEMRELRGSLAAEREAKGRVRAALAAAEQRAAEEAKALAEERAEQARQQETLRAEQAREHAAAVALQRELDAAQAAVGDAVSQLAQLRSEREARIRELDARQKQKDALASERDVLAKKLTESERALTREKSAAQAQTAQVQRLTEAMNNSAQRNEALQADLVRLREQFAQVQAGREFRTGNLIWNKLGLAYLSRRGKKQYRRMIDAKNRSMMWLSRLFRGRERATGTAVVTACWQWPIYSHTFVYQEMLGLKDMGLDVKLFHWDQGDMGQLHKAFGYLAENRLQIQPIWENHKRDKEHFEKTKPGRLKAFLEIIAARTGKTVAELEKEPVVMQGCTFARMAELAGARYLHSYFFYDQTFMAMLAAWLLEIPRGVSCYADHMLDDYPFKLVGLNVEMADVIVATSARIKTELSQKSGGKCDDKIIVKPNGVDGARFPAIERPARQKGEPFEVISVSRIEPKKGLTHLVEAVGELNKRGRKVIVHVVGSKDPHSKGSLEYADEFERRIADLGLAGQVILHGMMKQEDLAPILKRSRAFVAPYVEMGSGDKDGIPTAMLEGLASALPVVTTDSGSILEVVRDGIEGLVVPQRDSMAFANALQKLIDDPALERRLAKAARARFDKEFDIRVTEKRLHARVKALLPERRAKG